MQQLIGVSREQKRRANYRMKNDEESCSFTPQCGDQERRTCNKCAFDVFHVRVPFALLQTGGKGLFTSLCTYKCVCVCKGGTVFTMQRSSNILRECVSFR